MSTRTTRLGLVKDADGEEPWGDDVRGNFDTIDAVETITGLFVAFNETPSTTLNVKVWGGSYRNSSGARVDYAGAVKLLGASATTKLWLTDAGVLTTGSSYPGTPYTPLASVVTGASTVASITPDRIVAQAIGSASASAVHANYVYAGPTTGANDIPAFRALVVADIPSLPASILTTGTVAVARLPVMVASGASHAAGIVPDPGSSAGTTHYLREDGTWQVPPGSGGSGTVTSIDVTVPVSVFASSGGAVTTSGVIAIAFISQSANTFLASPNGSAGVPSMRAIVAADLPTSGVSAGTYTSATVTVDAYGRVVAASSGSSSPPTSETITAGAGTPPAGATCNGSPGGLTALTCGNDGWQVGLPSSPSDGQIRTVKLIAPAGATDMAIVGNGNTIQASYGCVRIQIPAVLASFATIYAITFQYCKKAGGGFTWNIIAVSPDLTGNYTLTNTLPSPPY